MDIIEAIATRRSIGLLKSEEPPREMVELLLDAAVMAPNHHETRPWRFFVLSGEARQDFGDVLACAVRRRITGESDERINALCEAERRKPLRAPVLIVVACKYSNSEKVIPIEDIAACAAATQNMLLSAHHLGLGAQWRTGQAAYDATVKSYFGLSSEDAIVGIIYLGFPDADGQYVRRKRTADFTTVTTWLD